MAVSKENKLLAQTVGAAFGGDWEVNRYYDDNHAAHVDILRSVNRPQPDLSSYSTLSLSDHPLYHGGREYPARVELVGACETSFEAFPNVLATAAFCIINSKWFCAPGVIFPDCVKMYRPRSAMQHVLFVPPFLWENDLRTMRTGNKTVAWLLAVPISDAEMRFAQSQGPDALEELLEEEGIDLFDIDRPSVVRG